LVLSQDITDEARNKDKKAEGSSALYGGRPNPDKGKGKGKKKGDDKKGNSRDSGKESKFCKNCKNPKAFHSPENCFVTNKKLRKEWEEKTRRKFVPFKEWSKEKDNKKREDDSSDDKEDSRHFAKDASYLCAHLNKSSVSIGDNSTLFDIGAETHIARSIDDIDARSYTPANLPGIDTASGEANHLVLGNGQLHVQLTQEKQTLKLSKVQYLPNYRINIFGARKLLGRGEIRIKDQNLVVNRQGLGLFRFDKNMMIIKEPKTYAFLAVSKDSPNLPIRLWHRRFGHLGLDNI
jgi:hypothetical protein